MEMLRDHVTKDGKCVYCCANVIKCAHPECETYFNPKTKWHRFCKSRCRVSHHRGSK